MRKLLATPLIVFLSSPAESSESGLIIPDFEKVEMEKVCCIYSPPEGFIVYNAPNGERVGRLRRIGKPQTDDQVIYKLFLTDTNENVMRQIDLEKDVQQIGYEVYAHTYHKQQSGFVKVLDKSDNYWLKALEIGTPS